MQNILTLNFAQGKKTYGVAILYALFMGIAPAVFNYATGEVTLPPNFDAVNMQVVYEALFMGTIRKAVG